MLKETWKPLQRFKNLYEVSDHGRVRNLGFRNKYGSISYRKTPRLLKIRRASNGYSVCVITYRMRMFHALVHRLVLEAFVGPCPPNHECDHENEIRDYNMLDNLRWMPISKNRARRIPLKGSKNGYSKLTDSQVIAIRSAYKGRAKGPTQKALGEKYGITQGAVRQLIERKTWKHI